MEKKKNNIADLRKENGMNQKELADKIGVAQTTVSAWEIGRNEPDNETLDKLAKLFGVTLGYVAGYESAEKYRSLTIEEYLEMRKKEEEEWLDRMTKEQEIEDMGMTKEELEKFKIQNPHDKFITDGKGMYFEAYSFNSACEYMNAEQRERALIILKAAFPKAFSSSYFPD